MTIVETASYAWIIDRVNTEFLDSGEVGTVGPRNAPDKYAHRLMGSKSAGRTFRMYDDDGNWYYTGRILADENTEDENGQGFGPLSDFGTPNAGCVEIRYFNSQSRKWETL